jgi:hypothetical protein
VHAVSENFIAEEASGDAFAHQAPIEIREHGDHGVDLPALDQGAQLGLGEHSLHTALLHARLSSTVAAS